MSVSFTRSMRTLQQTGAKQRETFLMILWSLLLVGWLVWFTQTPLTQYESSSEVQVVGATRAAVVLPTHLLPKLAVGQLAWVRLNAFPAHEYGYVEGVITAVDYNTRDGHVEVTLLFQEIPVGITPQRGLTGTAEIAINHTTPAQLLLTTIQQNLSR